MGKLIYKTPRICYENGNSVTGKEIYELLKIEIIPT